MTRPRPNDTELAQAVRAAVPAALVAYVFGSTVSGETRPGSDIDLAVLAAAPLAPVQRFDAHEAIARVLGIDVDLIDLRRASTVLSLQVITTGRLLYSDDERRRDVFENFTFSSYARLNEERAAILEQIAREGSVHGR